MSLAHLKQDTVQSIGRLRNIGNLLLRSGLISGLSFISSKDDG
jgi:hypothetical protein